MGELLIGCSGWDYPDPPPNGWLGVFYPSRKTKKLHYYSQFFSTAEMDSTFYNEFYSKMTKGTFVGLARATPEKFQFSVKVPKTITHDSKLSVKRGAMTEFEEFLDKISPLKTSNKLGVILIQLPPSFTVTDFRNIEGFLDRLPKGYDYAVEFRHESWRTEGPWEMLKHYGVAAVMTDSPDPNLQFLSDIVVTADHAFVRWHGRNDKFWYDYLYSKEELKPWADKIKKIKGQSKMLRGYFNNHLGGKAVLNALQFKQMSGSLSNNEKKAMEQVEKYLSGEKIGIEQWMQDI
ncbi:MAG: DUF72 domain-containing protein [Nitrososphaerales archaeon]